MDERQGLTVPARNVPDAKFKGFQIWVAFKDYKTWLMSLAVGAVCLNVAAFGAFLPTFVLEFGFSPRKWFLEDVQDSTTPESISFANTS